MLKKVSASGTFLIYSSNFGNFNLTILIKNIFIKIIIIKKKNSERPKLVNKELLRNIKIKTKPFWTVEGDGQVICK